MLRALFRPEAELMLFMHMRTKEIAKHSENVFRQKSYSVIPVTGNRGRRSEVRGQIFDWMPVTLVLGLGLALRPVNCGLGLRI